MNNDIATATVDQAADWYLKHRLQELSPAERQTFAEWLRASPLNVREYLAIAAISNDLPAAADVSPTELQTLIERSSSFSSPRLFGERGKDERSFSFPRRWAIAAVIAVLSIGAVSWFLLKPQDIQTAHGEQRILRLEDGSLMHLNSGTEATLRFSSAERLIELERGQSMFEVVHETARPFRVRVGAVDITALGTKFDVYRKPNGTAVTVLEGKVLVRSSVLGDAGSFQLTAGQQALIGSTADAPRAAVVDAQAETAWLKGDIKFFRQPLGEVAGEFNRYGKKPIEIEDPQLQQLRVSGIFNAYDTDSFLEFVRRLDGVAVRTDAERIRIGRGQR